MLSSGLAQAAVVRPVREELETLLLRDTMGRGDIMCYRARFSEDPEKNWPRQKSHFAHSCVWDILEAMVMVYP